MKCGWCDNDATHEVIVKPAKKKTVRGREGYTREVTSPVCGIHKANFERQGITCRPLEKKK